MGGTEFNGVAPINCSEVRSVSAIAAASMFGSYEGTSRFDFYLNTDTVFAGTGYIAKSGVCFANAEHTGDSS